jgi:hypothetical protein
MKPFAMIRLILLMLFSCGINHQIVPLHNLWTAPPSNFLSVAGI